MPGRYGDGLEQICIFPCRNRILLLHLRSTHQRWLHWFGCDVLQESDTELLLQVQLEEVRGL
jgi:hypothetical protein